MHSLSRWCDEPIWIGSTAASHLVGVCRHTVVHWAQDDLVHARELPRERWRICKRCLLGNRPENGENGENGKNG
jgi:hypothetical protein